MYKRDFHRLSGSFSVPSLAVGDCRSSLDVHGPLRILEEQLQPLTLVSGESTEYPAASIQNATLPGTLRDCGFRGGKVRLQGRPGSSRVVSLAIHVGVGFFPQALSTHLVSGGMAYRATWGNSAAAGSLPRGCTVTKRCPWPSCLSNRLRLAFAF